MTIDVSCVINAHREGHILFPTIQSVKRTQHYSTECGLDTEIQIILDNSDEDTRALINRELNGLAHIREVSFGDLAYSRNFAVENSNAKYMAFIDGDDLWSKSWLVDSFTMAERIKNPTVLHPEYNIFFGDEQCHVFNHVDMESEDFELESLLQMNYWTALSFSKTETFKKYPYRKNTILDGFGFEDWTWNYETIADGVLHKVVPGTVHFIRRGRPEQSLLAFSNKLHAIPRILDIYSKKVPSRLKSVA